jgi:hypothetical protein
MGFTSPSEQEAWLEELRAEHPGVIVKPCPGCGDPWPLVSPVDDESNPAAFFGTSDPEAVDRAWRELLGECADCREHQLALDVGDDRRAKRLDRRRVRQARRANRRRR